MLETISDTPSDSEEVAQEGANDELDATEVICFMRLGFDEVELDMVN